MGSGTHQMQVVSIDLVNQNPIWFDVTFPEAIPYTAERVIPVARRQRIGSGQQRDRFAQLHHVLTPFPASLTSRRNWVPLTSVRNDQIPSSLNKASAESKRLPPA